MNSIDLISIGYFSNYAQNWHELKQAYLEQEWHAHLQIPKCANLPALVRRRFTPLTRMVIESATECCRKSGDDLGSIIHIFASRNSEIGSLRTLLFDLFQNHSVSPSLFSNSLFHTACGYLSQAFQNTNFSRTISASEKTFEAGLLEAMMCLDEFPQKSVILSVGDEIFPEDFLPGDASEIKNSFCISLLFKTSLSDHHAIATLQATENMTTENLKPFYLEQLIKWLISSHHILNHLCMNTEITWTKTTHH